MTKPKYFCLFLALIYSQIIFCQETAEENKSKIASVLENYFDLEREAIHLHLDKTTFITNESIWYQGYIINRKTNKPFFTTNVFVVLYDEAGTQLMEKLIYASNGTFSGDIGLNSKMHSGNYYIQTYTNWMNNFSENESTITKVNIINPEEGIRNYKKINAESLAITISPEGGSFITDVANNIGVQLKDCRGNTPENLEALLQNNKGEVIKTIRLNQFGLGKFEVTPTDENLKVSVKYGDKTVEKKLPTSEKIGFSIDVNPFSIEGKTIIKIKTNKETASQFKSKNIYLLVHQDQKHIIYSVPIRMEFLEQTLSINNNDIAEGINTIRIIDGDLKQWSERSIYIYPKTENTTITKNGRNFDKIKLIGNSPYPNSSLSISVLPAETKSWDENNTIFSSLTVNPYLENPLEHSSYYFSNLGRLKFYALDLALLNQPKSKYDWNYMKVTIPTANYSFDIGITLKGKIDSRISNKTYHKVKLVSYKDLIMMSSDVKPDGEYLFEHVLLADSANVKISLQKLPNFEEIPGKLTPQVLNRKRPFNKAFRIVLNENCNVESDELITDFDIPSFASKAIQLEEVKVIKDVKSKLTYQNRIGNVDLRGFKVDDTMKNYDLINFIEANGFAIERNNGIVNIYNRQRNSINSEQATPQVYIDGRPLRSNDELTLMRMSEIDEIYINAYAIVPGVNNRQGVIKIYRSKLAIERENQKENPNSFYISNGFSLYTFFKNVDYTNTQSAGFENCGLINWTPRIISDDTGQFTFEITDYNKAKGRVIIEGMTPEGKLFQEENTINLK